MKHVAEFNTFCVAHPFRLRITLVRERSTGVLDRGEVRSYRRAMSVMPGRVGVDRWSKMSEISDCRCWSRLRSNAQVRDLVLE